MNLAVLLPELGERPSALTTSGLFLVKMSKGTVAVFLGEEVKAALGRGKALLRMRQHHARCQAAKQSRQGRPRTDEPL
jgi:hypothetical protein